jgi:hypothetical protein
MIRVESLPSETLCSLTSKPSSSSCVNMDSSTQTGSSSIVCNTLSPSASVVFKPSTTCAAGTTRAILRLKVRSFENDYLILQVQSGTSLVSRDEFKSNFGSGTNVNKCINLDGFSYIGPDGNLQVSLQCKNGWYTCEFHTWIQFGCVASTTSSTFSTYTRTVTDIQVHAGGDVYGVGSDNKVIKMAARGGAISTFAGTGTSAWNSNSGVATSVNMGVSNIAFSSSSTNLLITDKINHKIWQVSLSTSQASPFAFTGILGFNGDGTSGAALSARCNYPTAITVDKSGNVFFVDRNNYRIRKINTSMTVSTYVGNGGSSVGSESITVATSYSIDQSVSSIVTDNDLNLYFAISSSHIVKRVTTANSISTLVGSYGSTLEASYFGTSLSALLNKPVGLDIDPYGNLYIGDNMNKRIRKHNMANSMTYTVAGGVTGTTTEASYVALTAPQFVTTDLCGNLYFTDGSKVMGVKFSPTSSISSGSYVSHLCQSGSFITTTCSTVIPVSSYVSQACVAGSNDVLGSNTVITTCTTTSTPPTGSYTKSLCTAGSSSTAGTNFVILVCTAPVSGSTYTSTVCNAGTSTSVGVDTGLTSWFVHFTVCKFLL